MIAKIQRWQLVAISLLSISLGLYFGIGGITKTSVLPLLFGSALLIMGITGCILAVFDWDDVVRYVEDFREPECCH